MKKRIIVFILLFLIIAFSKIAFIYAYDFKVAGSGGNKNLCDNKNWSNSANKPSSDYCEGSGIVTWTKMNTKETFFCLDYGKAMVVETQMTATTNTTSSNFYACSVKKLYENSYDTKISFPTFVDRLNKGDANDTNRSTFMKMQQQIWDDQCKNNSKCTNDTKSNNCTNLTITNYTKKNAEGDIGIVNEGTTTSGDYYVTEITVNLSAVTSYEIVLSGTEYISTSVGGSKLDIKNARHSAKKLYVHVPKSSNDITVTLKLHKGQYVKNSGTRYTPKVTIYDPTGNEWRPGEDYKAYQRLGKVGYTSNPFTDYGYDADSNQLNLTINVCQLELDSINKTYPSLNNNKRAQLISLYTKLSEGGNSETYRNLLNFSSPTCGPATCSAKNDSACLSASISKSSNFGSDNISCYDSTVKNGTSTGYCQTKFDFSSQLSAPFTSISGQIFTNVGELGSNIGSGTITKTCYFYAGSNLVSSITDYGYSSYINNISFNGNVLDIKNKDALNSIELKRTARNEFEFVGSTTIDYTLPALYALNGSGEVKDDDGTYLTQEDCITTVDGKNYYVCKFLGYGAISKISDSDTINIPFSITFKGDLSDFDNVEEDCEYRPTPEIVKNGKLDLEFRTIDTDNPFPGKTGKIRTVGSNWCSKSSCSGDPSKNNTVLEEAVNRNDSYNKTKAGAKYTITLTPTDIKTIREYNKKTSYDDYTLYCDEDGYNCHSRFLDGLESGILKFYNTKTKKESTVGTIQNKLEIANIVLN